MNTVYIGLELRRVFRDYVSMFFIAVLPAFFYVIFGASQEWSRERAGNGNVAMYIMISMAAYGAVTATTGVGGMAAVERSQGWGRQLGLTPLTDRAYVAMKALVALGIATIPVLVIYALGIFTGAEGEVMAWVLSGLLLLVGACVFALYGLVMGLAFRTEAAISAASGALVVMGFLGNIFIPLSGTMLAIARFTPLYGYAALARYPVTGGGVPTTDGSVIHDPLWYAVANVGVWLTVFALLATWLVRRGRSRQ